MDRKHTLGLMLLAIVCWSRQAIAADENSLADPVVGKLHDKVTRFLDAVARGDTKASFGELLLGSPLADQPGLQSLIDKSREIAERYGVYRENEQISSKRIGKDVVLLKYLYKCDKFPVVWYFTYYRDLSRATAAGDDYWLVISVRFDTQIESLAN